MTRGRICISTALILMIVSATTVQADVPAHTPTNTLIEEVIVWGQATKQLGSATSASEGMVGYDDFSARALARVGELAEVVPGMVATQHSGAGKANQYFLRGVNLDHGTDFSGFFEGVPLNLRSHAHGHGYLDLNFLIPEVISTVRYQKGPYSPDRGDFSSVGTTSFSVYDSIDTPFVQIALGENGYQRLVSAGSKHLGEGHFLGAIEVAEDDGPWSLSSNLEKLNVLMKYTSHVGEGVHTKVVISHYDSSWRATDQIPLREVKAGRLGRFDNLDPNLGGETERTVVTAGLNSDRWDVSVFASRYTLDLVSNFTYFLEDPDNSDQFEQVDDRYVYGAKGHYTWMPLPYIELKVGGDLRYDDIGAVELNNTNAGRFVSSIRDDTVSWLGIGAYAQLTATFFEERLRSVAGIRRDHFDYRVDNALAGRSDDSDHQISNSFSLAYAIRDSVELYANWGQGFHSNDVRGTVVNSRGEIAIQPVDVFAKQEGYELGIRYELGSQFNASLTWFSLDSDSELLFVGDAGNTEPSDGSERTGYEFSLFWTPSYNWALDLNGAIVDSQFTGVPSQFNHIPNSFSHVYSGGITYTQPTGLEVSFRGRYFGEAPIVEDDSVRQDSSLTFNMGASYKFGRWRLGLDLLNAFDSKTDDIAYFFESRLATESAAVADVHFHPILPRTVRMELRYDLRQPE